MRPGLQAGHRRGPRRATSSIRTCSPACTAIICAARSIAAGLDPDNLPEGDLKTMNFGGGNGSKAKAWRDIWGSGQGIGAVDKVEPVAVRVDRLEREYAAARARLTPDTPPRVRQGLRVGQNAMRQPVEHRSRRACRRARRRSERRSSRATRRYSSVLASISRRACGRHRRHRVGVADRRRPSRRDGIERIARRHLAGIDRALRQQPGDDVHQPRRHLRATRTKSDPLHRDRATRVRRGPSGRNSRAPRPPAASPRHRACRSAGDGSAMLPMTALMSEALT